MIVSCVSADDALLIELVLVRAVRFVHLRASGVLIGSSRLPSEAPGQTTFSGRQSAVAPVVSRRPWRLCKAQETSRSDSLFVPCDPLTKNIMGLTVRRIRAEAGTLPQRARQRGGG
jgi:hypothetical protein